jgi:hypothetical protein
VRAARAVGAPADNLKWARGSRTQLPLYAYALEQRGTRMTIQKDVVQHIREEDNDFYADDDLFEISSWGADLSFRELIERYDADELVKPELQRKYVWDKTEASRFIDSLLLGLPVPSIFLAKTSDEKMLIVDGYQRIMTVYDYVKGIFSTDGKVFHLSRSEKINKRWRGKAFAELSETEQRKIRNTTIHAIIFVQQTPNNHNTSLYQVFERINTGGRTLVAQEIRNCIYQGKLNKRLFELNKQSSWRKLYGLEEEDSRMRDMEFILRFFALTSPLFAQQDLERISLKKFLNQYMSATRNPTDDELNALTSRFTTCTDFLLEHLGVSAFHNISPSAPDRLVAKFSPTIFDSLAIATDHVLNAGLQYPPIHFEILRRKLLTDDAYKSAISKETMTKSAISIRINKALEVLYGIKR